MTNILPTYPRSNLEFTHGKGCYLYSLDGNEYLDFGSGIAVNSLGYSHEYLNNKLLEQSKKLWHVSNIYQIPQQEMLAKRLCEISFADYAFFCNSGTESVEASIKIARRYFHKKNNSKTKNEIITFEGSFHGRTIGSLAAGGPDKLESFNTSVNGFKHIEFGNHELLKREINENTAAIIIEPLQGEGGIREVPSECLKGLRKICDENDTLLIFDEVQCGVGRTGKMFAHEWSDTVPDIMTVAKAIGNGFPLGVCLTSKRVGSTMDFGSHGSTYGGNPLASAVGNAVLDIMLEENFFNHVEDVSSNLFTGLKLIQKDFPNVIELVRGRGLMLGIKCKVKNTEFVEHARANKLLSVKASDNVVRLMPPLILNIKESNEGLEKIRSTCEMF
tara:strand:- start:1266 stop:2429 length:1164 start_codon:yes stop_codon:yes gene_type:complete